MSPRCPQCGSTRWTRDPLSQTLICEDGHFLAGFVQESIDTQEGPSIHTGQRRRLKKIRKDTQADDDAEGHQGPRSRKVKHAHYQGHRATFLKYQAFQYILRLQLQTLITKHRFPSQLEIVAKELFTLFLASVGVPDPVGDFNRGEEDLGSYSGYRGGSRFWKKGRGKNDEEGDEEEDHSERQGEEQGRGGTREQEEEDSNDDKEDSDSESSSEHSSSSSSSSSNPDKPSNRSRAPPAPRFSPSRSPTPPSPTPSVLKKYEEDRYDQRSSSPSSQEEEDYDPRIRLARQRERQENEESGKGKGKLRRDELRRRRPRAQIEVLMLILYLSCLTLRIPILLKDLLSLAERYELPYLHARYLLPKEMQERLNLSLKQSLDPNSIPDVLGTRTRGLYPLLQNLVIMYREDWEVEFPEANWPGLAWKLVEGCGLAPSFYQLLMAFLDLVAISEVDSTARDWVLPELHLLAGIQILLSEIFFGSPFEKSRLVARKKLPVVENWLKCLEGLKGDVLGLEKEVTAMTDSEIDRYLDFFEEKISGLGKPRSNEGGRSDEKPIILDSFPSPQRSIPTTSSTPPQPTRTELLRALYAKLPAQHTRFTLIAHPPPPALLAHLCALIGTQPTNSLLSQYVAKMVQVVKRGEVIKEWEWEEGEKVERERREAWEEEKARRERVDQVAGWDDMLRKRKERKAKREGRGKEGTAGGGVTAGPGEGVELETDLNREDGGEDGEEGTNAEGVGMGLQS
ncbi:hypothetical protein T439DRAFT_225039 [Meredithblackwellia eburnea MCA 4105]